MKIFAMLFLTSSLLQSATCPKIVSPWVRASSGSTSAVFMTLKNESDKQVSLVKAETDVCTVVELHDHIKEGNVFRMRPVEEISVPAKKEAILKPGGMHVMLIGLKAPLKEGDKVPLKLTFADGSIENLNVDVKSVHHKPCCNH